MKLSASEERVLAELEKQFQAGQVPASRCCSRLAVSVVSFLAGVALLMAANHAALAISLSNSYGFSTASITSGFAVTGLIMLLASAFLLGQAWDELRQGRHTAPTPMARAPANTMPAVDPSQVPNRPR